MTDQPALELKGRAPDPVLTEIEANPERIVRFRVTKLTPVIYADILDEQGEPTGQGMMLSYTALQGSRRANA